MIPGSFEKRGKRPLAISLTNPATKSEPFSADSLKAWRKRTEEGGAQFDHAREVKLMVARIEFLLMAASQKERFGPVSLSLAAWINEALTDFDLKNRLKDVHRDGITAASVLKKGFQYRPKETFVAKHSAEELRKFEAEAWERFLKSFSIEELQKWNLPDLMGFVGG